MFSVLAKKTFTLDNGSTYKIIDQVNEEHEKAVFVLKKSKRGNWMQLNEYVGKA